MSPEYKIDLSKYSGPMTVVGYPDLSVIKPTLQTQVQIDKSAKSAVNLNPDEHKQAQPKPRR